LRHSIAIAVVAILVPLGSLAAQPVMPTYTAPYPNHYPDANWDLSPGWVLAIVRSKGLVPLSQPQRQGPAYALRALDADREVQVTVDARSGRILRINTTAGAARPAQPNSIPYPEGADEQTHRHAARAPRPNVAPAAKLSADAASSKSGAEAAPLRPKVVADAASNSASTEAPVQAAPGPEIEE
jgi:hypothetical protein